MEQTKLTAKEVVTTMLTSFLVAVIFYLLAWIYIQLEFDGLVKSDSIVFFMILLFDGWLYVNYLMFVKFDDKDENDRHISRIARIKKVFQSIQLRRVLLSKDTLSFLLTTICGIVAAFIITICAGVVASLIVALIDVFHSVELLKVTSEWKALGIFLLAFVMSGVVASCIFAKWLSSRTHNAGVKWAAILPIIFIDLYALLALVGTPIEMLIRVLEGKPPLH